MYCDTATSLTIAIMFICLHVFTFAVFERIVAVSAAEAGSETCNNINCQQKCHTRLNLGIIK